MNFLEQSNNYKHKFLQYSSMVLLMIILQGILLFAVAYAISAPLKHNVYGQFMTNPETVDYHYAVLLSMTPIIATGLAVVLFFKSIHKAKPTVLVSAVGKIRIKKFFTGFLFSFLILTIYIVISLTANSEDVQFNSSTTEFLSYFLLLLPLLLLQVVSEELIFRSYIMQAVSAYSRNAWLPVLVSAIVFGVMHIGDPTSVEAIPMLLTMFMTGLVLSIVTVLDNGIEMAVGIHFANNLVAMSLSDAFNNPTLLNGLQTQEFGFVAAAVNVLCVLIMFGGLYCMCRWDWRRLFRKIERPVLAAEEE